MLDGPVVEFAFLARQDFLCTRFVVGSAYFVGLVARYLFRPVRYSLSFGRPCLVPGFVASFLPCRVEHSGTLE